MKVENKLFKRLLIIFFKAIAIMTTCLAIGYAFSFLLKKID